jgi:hypothetical protein
MSRNLDYTVQNILGELTQIVIYNSNLPEKIIECYEELQLISEDLYNITKQTGQSCEDLADEIFDIYLDMIDLYVEYLEIQASHMDML